jgi:hypothetical protein
VSCMLRNLTRKSSLNFFTSFYASWEKPLHFSLCNVQVDTVQVSNVFRRGISFGYEHLIGKLLAEEVGN